ncbi:putative RDD family membrane protein YckC [Bacillus ectoiniformans]|uniref:RDD family protein n=1 Tax=Bacillus ectoiniformans TaxID=1494429 RepID=UPI00195B070E|nr:RDD family protein [Bacillus ectoiniformans]MBM7648815.1 putative RDD family membrane protein YckC [Bacillus ectoiniformans]
MNDDHNSSREETLEASDASNEERVVVQEETTNQTVRPITPSLHYAGFWMRFWAYLLDLIVIGSISRILIYPLFRFLDIETASGDMFSAVNMATAFIFYLYFILTTKFFGQTVGKMIIGLKVISLKAPGLSWSTIIFRELLGRYISATIFILYVLVAFLPKKQGLHDYFADTTVVHERSLQLEKPAYS